MGVAVGVGVKQERRGGIETGMERQAIQRRSRKQERRGGIETEAEPYPSDGNGDEAGTPWWH